MSYNTNQSNDLPGPLVSPHSANTVRIEMLSAESTDTVTIVRYGLFIDGRLVAQVAGDSRRHWKDLPDRTLGELLAHRRALDALTPALEYFISALQQES